MLKAKKSKKCKFCKAEFSPFNTLQITCSIPCSIKYVNVKTDKEFKKKARKDRKTFNNNDRKYLLDKAQIACNKYIRLRDFNEPCISCGTTKPDIQYCAGHFKTRGARPDLRFNELNIFKQCNKHCNLSLSGNIGEYRPRLIDKIGIDKVEWLDTNLTDYKLTIDDIKEITRYYRDKVKVLMS